MYKYALLLSVGKWNAVFRASNFRWLGCRAARAVTDPGYGVGRRYTGFTD